MNRGKLTILSIFLLGASMAGAAVWYQHQQGRRCLEVWTVAGANLIRHAPKVEALRLGAEIGPDDAGEAAADSPQSDSSPDWVIVGGKKFAVVDRLDISQARGLIHARHALIVDHNYLDDAPSDNGPPVWNAALRFQDGATQMLMAFDSTRNVVQLEPVGRGQTLRAETMRVELAFIEREFSEAQARPSSDQRQP